MKRQLVLAVFLGVLLATLVHVVYFLTMSLPLNNAVRVVSMAFVICLSLSLIKFSERSLTVYIFWLGSFFGVLQCLKYLWPLPEDPVWKTATSAEKWTYFFWIMLFFAIYFFVSVPARGLLKRLRKSKKS